MTWPRPRDVFLGEFGHISQFSGDAASLKKDFFQESHDNKPEEAKSADMNEKEIKETNETNGANESNEAIGMNRITILITILGVIVLCGIVIKLGKKKRS